MSKKDRTPRLVSKKLDVLLTEQDKDERKKELLEAMQNVDTLRSEKSLAVQNYNAEIKLADTRVRQLAETLRSGKEARDVPCAESFDFARNVVVLQRTDTKEIVEERAMSLDERQEKLPLESDASATSPATPEGKKRAKKALGLEPDPTTATVGEHAAAKVKRTRKAKS